MFKDILMATDFSDASTAALKAAVAVAKKCLAHIQIVHVLSYVEEVFDLSHYAIPDLERQTSARRELDKFLHAAEYPNAGRDLLISSSVADEILKYARTGQYSLIVVGSHGRSALGRALLGSVTQKIVRDSEIPVMVVKDRKHSSVRYQGFDRVMCATDLSDSSIKAIEFAFRFANFLKADFHLIHVIDVPDLEATKRNYSIAIPEKSELNADLTLKKLVERMDFVGNVSVATLMGEPEREILNYADANHMDFLIMAAHKKGAMERILVGSVTAGVVARSGIPVITISPPE